MLNDNAQSETGVKWTEILRDYMIQTKTSEPHHPHQNQAEPEWGRLSKMVQNCLRVFNAPISLAYWCVKWCCQINNVSARKSLNWQVPVTISQGWTPDISHLRFHFYKPIWYFQPNIKSPKNNLLKGRFLAFADSCGNALTYYILTEPEDRKVRRQVLMPSAVRTRRK
mmetsp:Transcript_26234/g.54036  ORF Transcript_26234/g.54036 Transcript_26234/m.54036 type:complete len:168 (-) Transcript_26234:33-536(-)